MRGIQQLIRVFLALAGEVSHGFAERCQEWPTDQFVRMAEDDSKCYWMSKESTSWNEAKESCHINGGRLVHILTPVKYQFVKDHFPVKDVRCAWIGVSDQEKEGDWRWTDGTRMTYNEKENDPFSGWLTNWSFDCSAICTLIFEEGFRWKDTECYNPWEYICEADILKDVVTDKPDDIPYIPRKRRRKQIFGTQKLERFPPARLLGAPDMKEWSPIATVCASLCEKLLSPCKVFNFNPISLECYGYKSVTVLDSGIQEEDGWEIWQVL